MDFQLTAIWPEGRSLLASDPRSLSSARAGIACEQAPTETTANRKSAIANRQS
jgi:hypothetical protein